jgi:hypothetical protein
VTKQTLDGRSVTPQNPGPAVAGGPGLGQSPAASDLPPFWRGEIQVPPKHLAKELKAGAGVDLETNQAMNRVMALWPDGS